MRVATRVAAYVVVLLAAGELLYLVAVHAVILSGVIQSAASADPDSTTLGWDRAWSPWPTRVYVTNLRLQVQDPTQEFRLDVAYAKVDVVLWELLRRKFRASHVEARGVSYRMLVKVKTAHGIEKRLAAFPAIAGYPQPPLVPNPPPPPLSPAEIAGLWSVQLDQVDAAVEELWFLEYRYRGPAQVHGGFALAPLRTLWVGPATLQLEGGKLTAGEKLVSSELAAHLDVTVTPTDLPSAKGLKILRGFDARLRFDTALADLGVADLYVEGLRARGTGRLTADVGVSHGKLVAGSTVEIAAPSASLDLDSYRFKGSTKAKLAVREGESGPEANATLEGTVDVPWFGKVPAQIAVSSASGDLALRDGDLTQGLRLRRLRASVKDARVHNVGPINETAGNYLPVAAPAVFGDGPLVASASFEMGEKLPLVRLTRLTLGHSEARGAAFSEPSGWTGAADGRFGALRLGFRLHDSKPEFVPFPDESWLAIELAKKGIQLE